MTTLKEYKAMMEGATPLKWYGYAGHFIGGKRCAFHLSTNTGKHLISTVGHYLPKNNDDMVNIGAGREDYFETYVFVCDGEDKDGNPNVTEWLEIDGERYADSLSAEKGHYKYLEKYSVQNVSAELIRVIELAEEALSQWVSATGGQYDPVKERITEQALSEIRKLKGE